MSAQRYALFIITFIVLPANIWMGLDGFAPGQGGGSSAFGLHALAAVGVPLAVLFTYAGIIWTVIRRLDEVELNWAWLVPVFYWMLAMGERPLDFMDKLPASGNLWHEIGYVLISPAGMLFAFLVFLALVGKRAGAACSSVEFTAWCVAWGCVVLSVLTTGTSYINWLFLSTGHLDVVQMLQRYRFWLVGAAGPNLPATSVVVAITFIACLLSLLVVRQLKPIERSEEGVEA